LRLEVVPKRCTDIGGKRRSVGERNAALCRGRDSEALLRMAHVVMPESLAISGDTATIRNISYPSKARCAYL
jgi:hypothetical protein